MEVKTKKSGFWAKLVRVLVPLIILAAGGAAAAYFQATKPGVGKVKPKARAPYVETIASVRGPVTVEITAMGTVAPALKVSLEPEVEGRVVWVSRNFAPGGIIPKGGLAVRLDKRDYEIDVRKKTSAVAKAKAELAKEYGQQEVAREEIKLLRKLSAEALEENADLDLALRKPDLEQDQADLALAEADLARARLDLERTGVHVPFNSLVTERLVNLGSQVSKQETLGYLVGTDEYWVEAAVPVDRLPWLNLDHENGSKVVIRSQTSGQSWPGRAERVTGTLTDNTRMAKVLVTVEDPLGLKNPAESNPMILGDYVSAHFVGRGIEDVVAIPREALRQGDVVWVAADGVLDVRPVEVAWKDHGTAYVGEGLDEGDLVVVSDLAAPIDGMPVRATADDNAGKGKKGER